MSVSVEAELAYTCLGNEIVDLLDEPLKIPILTSTDPGADKFKIDLEISRWRSSPDPTIEAKLLFHVVVEKI